MLERPVVPSSQDTLVFFVKVTWGEGSKVLQLERERLRREEGGLVSNNMERGWLSRLLTWRRCIGKMMTL